MKLGVNIDHVATIRQARGIKYPDPVTAAAISEIAGASGITVHLREDRRHIQDRDVRLLMQTIKTKLNLEMAVSDQIIDFALEHKPHCACIVPEKRKELTTEGGLDVVTGFKKIKKAVTDLQNNGTLVSLFIDPDDEQISASVDTGATFIELHTGSYAESKQEENICIELNKLVNSAEKAIELGLRVNAGHGLNYHNVLLMHEIPYLEELNIGHSIIARAVISGLDRAVRDMIELIS